MTHIMTPNRTRMSRVLLGLSVVIATATPALSASQRVLQGSLSAYPVDGTYEGSTQPAATNIESCRPAQPLALDVHDGRFKLEWTDRQPFEARIRPDGTFYATTVASPIQAEKHMTITPTLQGRVGATGLVADYGTVWCRYRLEASRSSAGQHLGERADGIGASR